MTKNYFVLTLLFTLAAADPAGAHHSFSADYDANNKGELAGKIARVQFRNPHVYYVIEAELPDGTTENWRLETHNIVTLRELGWGRDSLQVGDRITVTGALGRRGRKMMSMDLVRFEGGEEFSLSGGEKSNAYQLKEVTAIAGKDYGVKTNEYPLDITGGWDNRHNFVLTVNDLTPKPTPFTEEGRAVFEATKSYQDLSKFCISSGLPRKFGAPRSMEIVDAGDYYMMLYGAGNEARRIWMDGREPPVDSLNTTVGFSVGEWRGKVLVIETTSLTPGWLDGSGLPMSGGTGTRIIEEYTVSDDGLTMERKMTIHDDYYTEPLVRMRGSARGEDLVLQDDPPCDPREHVKTLLLEKNLVEMLRMLE